MTAERIPVAAAVLITGRPMRRTRGTGERKRFASARIPAQWSPLPCPVPGRRPMTEIIVDGFTGHPTYQSERTP